jgi:hypothetical protein
VGTIAIGGVPSAVNVKGDHNTGTLRITSRGLGKGLRRRVQPGRGCGFAPASIVVGLLSTPVQLGALKPTPFERCRCPRRTCWGWCLGSTMCRLLS